LECGILEDRNTFRGSLLFGERGGGKELNKAMSWVRSNKAKVAISAVSVIGVLSLVLLMFSGNGELNLNLKEMKSRLFTSENLDSELTVFNAARTAYVQYHARENIAATDTDPMSILSTGFVNPEYLDDGYLCKRKNEVIDLLNSKSVSSSMSSVDFPTEADNVLEMGNSLHEQLIKFDSREIPNKIVDLMRGAILGEGCSDNPESYKLLGNSEKVYKMGTDKSFVYEYSVGSYLKKIFVVIADGSFLVTIDAVDSFAYEALDNNEVNWDRIVKTALVKLYNK